MCVTVSMDRIDSSKAFDIVFQTTCTEDDSVTGKPVEKDGCIWRNGVRSVM
jgi:hypothetical protein